MELFSRTQRVVVRIACAVIAVVCAIAATVSLAHADAAGSVSCQFFC